MGTYEDIEDLAPDFGDDDDVCNICWADEWEHDADCPKSPSNRFFDEEIIVAEEMEL